MKVDIYVDITHKGNPMGSGSACAVIACKDKSGNEVTREVDTTVEHNTKNALALIIITKALKKLIKPCEVVLHLDNKHIKACITQGWLENWSKNGWKKTNEELISNLLLWKGLYISMQLHKISFAPYQKRKEFIERKEK